MKLVYLLLLYVSAEAIAENRSEMTEALKARSELVKKIDQASYIGGRCKELSRTSQAQLEHQDRNNKSKMGKYDKGYWKHAEYTYKSSLRRLESSPSCR